MSSSGEEWGSGKKKKRKLRRSSGEGKVNFADLEFSFSSEESLTHLNQEEVDQEIASASRVGLPPGQMSWKEKRELPGVAVEQPESYVDVRNSILRKWCNNMNEYLTKKEACQGLKKSFFKLASLAHDFLTRYGYINTGVFDNPRTEWNGQRVLVLGAGASGLAAASQLHHLGYVVTVLEARQRVGGRVNTDTSLGGPVDLGAMVVTGTEGNPVYSLVEQLKAPTHPIHSKCDLFLEDGKIVDPSIDKKIEAVYNTVLKATKLKVHQWQLEQYDEETPKLYSEAIYGLDVHPKLPVPGTDYNSVKEEKPDVKDEKDPKLVDTVNSFYSNIDGEQEDGSTTETKVEVTNDDPDSLSLDDLKAKVDTIKEKKKEKEETEKKKRGQEEFHQSISVTRSKLNGIDKYSLGRGVDYVIHSTENIFAADVEERIFDWHIGNLEYGCATEMANISLKRWDQDDQYELDGGHYLLPQGYSPLFETLAKPLDIRFGEEVTKVEYGKERVKVTTNKGTHEADIVLVTLPLGVLKQGSVTFSPPLPKWKIEAINQLGFGNLNKIALSFDEVFWDDSTDFFGVVPETIVDRGKCFLFNNMHKCMGKPILLALVAGSSAYAQEEMSDDEIISECVAILRKAYPNCPDPTGAVITRWYQDCYARGSYSYVAVGSKGEDYDLMALPISRRVFFAGEATQREHPATVAGAFLSGLREAGRIDRAWRGPLCDPSPASKKPVKPKKRKRERDTAWAMNQFSFKTKKSVKTGSGTKSDKKKSRSPKDKKRQRRDRVRRWSAWDTNESRFSEQTETKDWSDKNRPGSSSSRADNHSRRHTWGESTWHSETIRTTERSSRKDYSRGTKDSYHTSERSTSSGWDVKVSTVSDSNSKDDGQRSTYSGSDRISAHVSAHEEEIIRRSSGSGGSSGSTWEKEVDAVSKTSSSSSVWESSEEPQKRKRSDSYDRSPRAETKKLRVEGSSPGRTDVPFVPTPVTYRKGTPPHLSESRPKTPPHLAESGPSTSPHLSESRPKTPPHLATPAAASPAVPFGSTPTSTHFPPLLEQSSWPRTPNPAVFPPHSQFLSPQQQQLRAQYLLQQQRQQQSALPEYTQYRPPAQPAQQPYPQYHPPVQQMPQQYPDYPQYQPQPQQYPAQELQQQLKEDQEQQRKQKREEKKKHVKNSIKAKSKSEAKFRKVLSKYIVHYLKKTYLDTDKIATKDDFKHLARKFTHLIFEKELRSVKRRRNQRLQLNDKVKRKVRKFIDSFFLKLDGPYSHSARAG